MKTLNPFIPTVPLISVPSRSRRERFKKVVFFILAAHVVLLLSLLMTDYRRDMVIYARELPAGTAPPAIAAPETPAEPAAAPAPTHAHTATLAMATPAAAKSAPVLTKAAAAPARPETTYTVQAGDTLNEIAKKYGTTVKAIKAANALPTEHLHVTQKLRIP